MLRTDFIRRAMKKYNLLPSDTTWNYLLLVTIAGSVLIYLWGIWSVPVLSHNEARRMVVVQEMLANQDYLIPTMNGHLYVTKPPLFYWVSLVFVFLFNSTAEWVFRLPCALSALIISAVMFIRIKENFGPRAALFSALFLVTCKLFITHARLAEIEMLLTLECVLALLFFLDYLKKDKKKYLYLSYLFSGLAFLTKGPVALVFFLPPLIVFAAFLRDKKTWRGLLFLPGWCLWALVAFPWFIYVYFSLGTGPLGAVAEKDLAGKVFDFSAGDPIYYYLLQLMGYFVPWICLVIFFKPKENIKKIFSNYAGAYIACAFFVPLIIMSLIAVKHGKYIMPLIPFCAAFLGIWGDAVQGMFKDRWPTGLQTKFSIAASGLVLVYFLFFVIITPRMYSYRFESLKPMATKMNAIKGAFPAYCYREEMIQLIYYYQHPLPVIDDQMLADKLSAGESFLLVAKNRHWRELEGRGLCIQAHFAPFLRKKTEANIYGSHGACGDL